MTKARQRYEAKTRVVTFRVHQEMYSELEEVKGRCGLSYSDLIKLGAGIAQEEIKAKLADLSGLRHRVAELKASVEEERQRLNESLEEERRRRLEELDVEIAAYKLFDRGRRIETVGHKLKIPLARIRHYFDEWAEERNDKEAAERELVKRCLKEHIDRLEEDRLWDGVMRRASKGELAVLQRGIDDCWRLLSVPEQMRREDREFLIAKYSPTILPAPRRKKF